MRPTQVKKQLTEQGLLDARQLFSYSTGVGTIHGQSFQGLLGICFLAEQVVLLRAETDGRTGDILAQISLRELSHLKVHSRFLYGYIEFSWLDGSLRLYNYDKKVLQNGLAAAASGL